MSVPPRSSVSSIDQRKFYSPVLGINDYLHRIANVVQTELLHRLCVRKIVARRIGVLYPVQLASADHQIRIVVEAEEWGNRAHLFLDVAADHDATIVGDVARKRQVYVTEVPRKEVFPKDPTDRHP